MPVLDEQALTVRGVHAALAVDAPPGDEGRASGVGDDAPSQHAAVVELKRARASAAGSRDAFAPSAMV